MNYKERRFAVLNMMGFADAGVTEAVASFALGLSFGTLLVGVIFTSRYMRKIREFKKRYLRRENEK